MEQMKFSEFKPVPVNGDEFIKYLIERMSMVSAAIANKYNLKSLDEFVSLGDIHDTAIPSVNSLKAFLKRNKLTRKDHLLLNVLINYYCITENEAKN